MNSASVFTYLGTNIFKTAALEPQKPEINFRDPEPCARAPVWRACKSQLDHFDGRTHFLKVINELCVYFYLLGHKRCRNSVTRAAKSQISVRGTGFQNFGKPSLYNGPKCVLTFCPQGYTYEHRFMLFRSQILESDFSDKVN